MHYRNYILFKSAYTTIENIYAFDINRKSLYQVTFSRFGASCPSVSPDSTELLFSTYTDHGFDIARTSLDPSLWKQIAVADEPSGIWPFAKGTEYPGIMLPDSVAELPHQAVSYGKLAHLINVHSWLPFYVPLGNMHGSDNTLPVELGFMLFSQNLLSTFISSIGYHYDHGNHYLTPKITWRGWYPIFELSGQIGGPSRSYPFPEGLKPTTRLTTYYDYYIKTYVPLFFDRGKHITYFLPQLEYEHNSTNFYINGNEHNGLHYVHSFLYATRYLRMSQRDLFPRLGGYVSASYTNTPLDEGQLGSMFSLQGGVYLPGIGDHHHLLLKAGWQKQDPGLYYLSINRLVFPRGYASEISAEIRTFSVDYALPLLYPDWAVEPVIYLKRIRADVFYDRSYGKDILEGEDKRYTGTYESTGAELMADFHAGRIIFPLAAGVRTGYLLNTGKLFTEFLFRIQM
jgi:hypothetical protein